MTSTNCKPVWPTVFYSSCFLVGYAYGAEKQLGFYGKASAQIDKEQRLIQKYREAHQQEIEKQKGIIAGEDPTLYNVPKGLRQLSRSFKETSL